MRSGTPFCSPTSLPGKRGVRHRFGPLAAHWQPRVQWGGTYGDKWAKDRQPLLPEDFDERFFQSAPEDQQAPTYLKGGEAVELVKLLT